MLPVISTSLQEAEARYPGPSTLYLIPATRTVYGEALVASPKSVPVSVAVPPIPVQEPWSVQWVQVACRVRKDYCDSDLGIQ